MNRDVLDIFRPYHANQQEDREYIRLLKEASIQLEELIRAQGSIPVSHLLNDMTLVTTLQSQLTGAIKQFEALSTCSVEITGAKPKGEDFIDKKLAERSDELAREVLIHANGILSQRLQKIIFPSNEDVNRHLSAEEWPGDEWRNIRLDRARNSFEQARTVLSSSQALGIT